MYDLVLYYLLLGAASWTVISAWIDRDNEEAFRGFYLSTWCFIIAAILQGVMNV